MDELFKKTNEFLSEFEEIVNKKIKPPSVDSDLYDFEGELKYISNKLWEKESNEYLFGAVYQYQSTRNEELKELTDKGIYFRFCKFKVYQNTYEERLNKFLKIYEDSQEIHFLEDELEAYSEPIGSEEPFKHLDLEQKKDLNYTRDKTVKFIVQKAKERGYILTVSVDKPYGTLSYVKEEVSSIPQETLFETNSAFSETKPLLDYLKIGALIASGELTMIKGSYIYQGKKYNKQDVVKQLESDLSVRTVRQYLEGTYGADTDTTLCNDFFRNETKIKKIVKHCQFNNIAITEDYQSLFDSL